MKKRNNWEKLILKSKNNFMQKEKMMNNIINRFFFIAKIS